MSIYDSNQKLVINVGKVPNDGQGDPLRTIFIKTNNNFSDLYTFLGNGTHLGNISRANLGNVTIGNVIGNVILTGTLKGNDAVFTNNVSAKTFLGNIIGYKAEFITIQSTTISNEIYGNITGNTALFTDTVKTNTLLGNVIGNTAVFTDTVKTNTLLGNVIGNTAVFTTSVNTGNLSLTGNITSGSISPEVNFPVTGVVPGTYGNTTHYPILTVDATGRLTSVSSTTSGGGAVQNVLYVSKSGNDSNNGTELAKSKLTIKAAVDVANALQAANPAGATCIFVKSGSYTEINPISLSAGVSIVGDNLRAVTVIPSNPTKDIFWVRNRCYITGMTFRTHVHPSAAIAFPKREFTGTISGTTLTVSGYSSPINDIRVGMYLVGTGVAANTIINSFGTGTGGNGTYIVNNSQNVGPISMRGAEYIITSPYVQNASSITTGNSPIPGVLAPTAAGDLVPGYTYEITTLGNTDWDTVTGDIGGIYSVGKVITAIAANPGTTGDALLLTGCGMRVDGNLALGLKSMVLDAYTQYNCNGIGIHIINSGYSQLVSIFTICCSAGVKNETGGYCSITNSNNSFGKYGLWSDGAGEVLYTGNLVSFTRDTLTFTNLSQTPAVNDAIYVIGTPNAPNNPSSGNILVRSATPINNGNSTITFAENIGFTPTVPQQVEFRQISIISASGQTFEYIGTGVNILTSTPRLGGIPVQANEIHETNGGRVSFTSTDQFGDYRIGSGLLINEEAGVIEGETFDKSLFAVLTPYILALEG